MPARPVFENYVALYSNDMKRICAETFKTYSHWSVAQRAEQAGKAIIRDMKKKIASGSLALAPNQGKYAVRKARAGHGDAPFRATGALLKSLEVVVE